MGEKYNKNIFSGYTKSAFILQRGLYIASETWNFEIYFDANATLLNRTDYLQQVQSISDKNKKEDEEEAAACSDD